MNDIKTKIRLSKSQEVDNTIQEKVKVLESEGYTVEFGKIGVHTTYALLCSKSDSREIVGYTFLKDMRYYQENVGNLKALQQAIARKELAENNQ